MKFYPTFQPRDLNFRDLGIGTWDSGFRIWDLDYFFNESSSGVVNLKSISEVSCKWSNLGSRITPSLPRLGLKFDKNMEKVCVMAICACESNHVGIQNTACFN